MIKNTDRYKVWNIDLDSILSIIGCSLPLSYGDDYCDDENNNEACFFDGGDCCGPGTNAYSHCTKCQCLEDMPDGGLNTKIIFHYTANILCVEYADICFCSKFKNKHVVSVFWIKNLNIDDFSDFIYP